MDSDTKLLISCVEEMLILNSSDTDYILTKEYSGSGSKQIPISNDVKMLQKVGLGKQREIGEKERRIKARNYQLKKAIKDVDILQGINLGHQKEIEEKDKAIEEKDNHIMRLNESIKDIC